MLYISLHRYEEGSFFPCSEDADYDKVGRGKGAGYNVNIPWNRAKMGDPEYLAAFHHLVMPIAREVNTHTHTCASEQFICSNCVLNRFFFRAAAQFSPELVLVSAGFDAARGDPLGGYQVTPECYAHLTHQLLSLAAGRVLVILEVSEWGRYLDQGYLSGVQTSNPPVSSLFPRPLSHFLIHLEMM